MLNWQILPLFKLTNHPRWKNCKFVSRLQAIKEYNVYVTYCYIKWDNLNLLISTRVLLISPKLRIFNSCYLTRKVFLIWLTFWYQKLHMFEKSREMNRVKVYTILIATFNINFTFIVLQMTIKTLVWCKRNACHA